jgi:hypothetical protein
VKRQNVGTTMSRSSTLSSSSPLIKSPFSTAPSTPAMSKAPISILTIKGKFLFWNRKFYVFIKFLKDFLDRIIVFKFDQLDKNSNDFLRLKIANFY